MSDAKFPGYWGGFNNGKTYSLCLRGIKASLEYPNNAGLIARRTYPQLRDTTRRTFFEILGCNESSITNHPYVERWSASENFLRFINGSMVYFRHLDDEAALASLLSLNLGWFGIDQAEEVPEAAFLTLIGRIGRVEGGPPAWGATVGNPAGHNWIWRRWKRKDVRNPQDYHLLEAMTTDNPFAAADYVQTLLDSYDSHWIQRYVYGSWDAFKGQVYDEWDENVHVIDPVDIDERWIAGLGADFGYNHPTVFLFIAVDWNGIVHVYDEVVGREKLPEWYIDELKQRGIVNKKTGFQHPVYGPHDIMNRNPVTGKNLQAEYQRQGLYIYGGNRMKPYVGIQRIKQLLKIDPNRKNPFTGKMGCPGMVVHRHCEQFIEEVGVYRWKDLKPGQEDNQEQPDEVVKVNDDAMDAFRAWAMSYLIDHEPIHDRKRTLQEEEQFLFMPKGEDALDVDWRYL